MPYWVDWARDRIRALEADISNAVEQLHEWKARAEKAEAEVEDWRRGSNLDKGIIRQLQANLREVVKQLQKYEPPKLREARP